MKYEIGQDYKTKKDRMSKKSMTGKAEFDKGVEGFKEKKRAELKTKALEKKKGDPFKGEEGKTFSKKQENLTGKDKNI